MLESKTAHLFDGMYACTSVHLPSWVLPRPCRWLADNEGDGQTYVTLYPAGGVIPVPHKYQITVSCLVSRPTLRDMQMCRRGCMGTRHGVYMHDDLRVADLRAGGKALTSSCTHHRCAAAVRYRLHAVLLPTQLRCTPATSGGLAPTPTWTSRCLARMPPSAT